MPHAAGRVVRVAFVIAAALALAGCPKPKTGDLCGESDPDFCETDTLAISCIDGKFAPFVCPAGCTGQGICNYAQNGVGDPCTGPASTAATPRCRNIETHETLDCKTEPCQNAAGLFCDEGALRELPCRGPDGCLSDPEPTTRTFECDQRLGEPGDPCHSQGEGSGNCGKSNPQQILVCKGGVLEVFTTCSTACVIDSQNRVVCQQ